MSGSKPMHADSKPEYLRRTDSHKVDDDRIYTADEREFMLACDRYKRVNRRPFPAWSEILQVALSLGYAKICPTCGQAMNALPITIPDPDEEDEEDEEEDTPVFDERKPSLAG